MIWNLAIILIVVIILILVARRLPDARQKLSEEKEISTEEMSLFGLVAQADDAFDRKSYAEAEKLYLKAAAGDPDNPKIFSRLGAIYLEEQNFYDAKDSFYYAVKLDPELASRHVNLGLAYMGLKDYFKASESFKAALKLDKKNKKYEKFLEKAEKALERERRKA